VNLQTAFQLLLLGPVLVVWVIALRDAYRSSAGHRRRRVLVLVPLVALPPLSVLYLLTRPPVSVRRGAVRRDDPRSELLDRLEAASEAG
jgi:hypothetical protein